MSPKKDVFEYPSVCLYLSIYPGPQVTARQTFGLLSFVELVGGSPPTKLTERQGRPRPVCHRGPCPKRDDTRVTRDGTCRHWSRNSRGSGLTCEGMRAKTEVTPNRVLDRTISVVFSLFSVSYHLRGVRGDPPPGVPRDRPCPWSSGMNVEVPVPEDQVFGNYDLVGH